MNRPRLSKSGVEYLDYSWGIWSGCQNLQTGICSVKACWAKGIANHYPKLYPNGFNPTYYPEAIDSPKHLRKPSIISVGWVGDVIGYGIEHKDEIFETIRHCPQHKFLFLTKNPERLKEWEGFPDNCWVGVSVTDRESFNNAVWHLKDIDAKVRYLSFEPLLGQTVAGILDNHHDWPVMNGSILQNIIHWAIIGSQTKPTVMPKIEWVSEIVQACDNAGIPVFLKDSLELLLGQNPDYKKWQGTYPDGNNLYGLRQEMPIITSP